MTSTATGPASLGDPRDHRGHRFARSEVRGHGQRVPTARHDLVGRDLRSTPPVRAPLVERDRRALGRERLRDRRASAATGTGDQHDAVTEPKIHRRASTSATGGRDPGR